MPTRPTTQWTIITDHLDEWYKMTGMFAGTTEVDNNLVGYVRAETLPYSITLRTCTFCSSLARKIERVTSLWCSLGPENVTHARRGYAISHLMKEVPFGSSARREQRIAEFWADYYARELWREVCPGCGLVEGKHESYCRQRWESDKAAYRGTTSYDPETDQEWQEAVDLAYFYLVLASARQYGLVTGGPEVDVERCEQILTQGRNRGFKPSKSAIKGALYGQAPE